MKRHIWLFLIFAALFLYSFPVAAAIEIQSEAAILIDADTGQILYGKNIDNTYSPGNLTKLITAYVALENGNLTENLIVLESTIQGLSEDSVIGLQSGERISLDNALYATVVGNANDAAKVVAENIGGGIENFVTKMNLTAIRLGAIHTNFVNATGVQSSDQVTTAHDLANFMQVAVKNTDFLRYLTTDTYEIPATNLSNGAYPLTNLHNMVNGAVEFSAVNGGILAYTEDGLYSSISYAVSEESRFIVITMKSSSYDVMYEDIKTIVNHAVNDWKPITLTERELKSYLPDAASGKKIVFENLGAIFIPASDSLSSLNSLISIDENQYFSGDITLNLKDNPIYIGKVVTIKFFEADPKSTGIPWALIAKVAGIVIIVLIILLFIARFFIRRRRKDPVFKGTANKIYTHETPAIPKTVRVKEPRPKAPTKPKKEKSNRAFYEARRNKKNTNE